MHQCSVVLYLVSFWALVCDEVLRFILLTLEGETVPVGWSQFTHTPHLVWVQEIRRPNSFSGAHSQRAQYGLIKEYTLNHIKGPYVIKGKFPN